MSGADDRTARKTRRFDSAKLAALTKDAGTAEPAATPAIPVTSASERPPTRSRTATLEDPMTTAMLAEVARRAQTIDFDSKLIEQVVENLGEGDTSHPHTRRRKG